MSGFVWLASYPKSGNTWMRLALASLLAGGTPPDFAREQDFAPVAADRGAFDFLLDVDSADLRPSEVENLRPLFHAVEARRAAEARGEPRPLVRKVHDAWTRAPSGAPLFPPELTAAALYIARDPRDVAPSLADHFGIGIDAAIDFMGAGRACIAGGPAGSGQQLPQRLLDWGGHVRSWLDAPVGPLLIRYEDMLADPAAALAAVARHLGWPAPAEAVARAVEGTRFPALRAAEERHGFHERMPRSARFFRRGVAGGWRDALSPAQAARIEADHGPEMARLGYG